MPRDFGEFIWMLVLLFVDGIALIVMKILGVF